MRHIVSAVAVALRKGRPAALAGLVGSLLTTQATLAGDGKDAVVVELYTSQGCSSCPPADEFMGELAQAEHVIALSLHVDYWDYIGWEDSFANPAYTERQKAYARAAGSRMIYTPQMVVGGVDRVEGNEPDAVVRLIGRHLSAPRPVALTVTRDGDRVTIRAEANPPLAKGVTVQLVRYSPVETVEITRGENAGRVMSYHNVVTLWQKIGEWPGTAPFDMVADAPGDEPVVVIVQEAGPAAILAAAQVD
ncbi:DUF1223 domain-containing protein [Paragemmobacter straminiformis]|uniref:DUF1223 domain-containing protein n=1 Tax=Paragemmobacter straminiformis TaxID=2045119 RepID=A0A842I9W0_9RHOB|nr:DUF1223 domain-containing protein [Gemmobacter straminiformis]MBC2835884.1 DUF1223 domain-containing protein [Gemmobacter straminiformis]